MGDAYAQALGEGIKGFNKDITILNLSNNRLSDKGAFPVLTSLSKEVIEIDLSNNPMIGLPSY